VRGAFRITSDSYKIVDAKRKKRGEKCVCLHKGDDVPGLKGVDPGRRRSCSFFKKSGGKNQVRDHCRADKLRGRETSILYPKKYRISKNACGKGVARSGTDGVPKEGPGVNAFLGRKGKERS